MKKLFSFAYGTLADTLNSLSENVKISRSNLTSTGNLIRLCLIFVLTKYGQQYYIMHKRLCVFFSSFII